jgi:hypothetical protein
MKELSNVDYDNYGLFLGDSFTVGIGIPLEQSYSYRVSQHLNIDYVNAGIGGTSTDMVINNFVYFMNRCPKNPKFVAINWPEIARTFYWIDFNYDTGNGKIIKEYPLARLPNFHHQESDKFIDSYREFLMEETHQFKRFQFLRETAAAICKNADIPLIEISTNLGINMKAKDIHPDIYCPQRYYAKNQLDISNYKSKINMIERVFGRDVVIDKRLLAHPGFDYQEIIADYIIKKLEAL